MYYRKQVLRKKRYYVYVLDCADKSYYTGVTNSINRRFREHCYVRNPHCYTATRLPVILRYYMEYNSILEAIDREKQIKGWSRKKKEALFMHDWNTIKLLAINTAKKKMFLI